MVEKSTFTNIKYKKIVKLVVVVSEQEILFLELGPKRN
jgi:hypothetical protein